MYKISEEEKNKFLTDLNSFVQNKVSKQCIVMSEAVKMLVDIDDYANEIWTKAVNGGYKT